MEDKPNIQQLHNFNVKGGGTIHIIQDISTNYNTFGVCLLNDENSTIMRGIVHNHPQNTESINEEIFVRWLDGKGKRPVTWKTLVTVLREVKLHTLADQIEGALLQPPQPQPILPPQPVLQTQPVAQPQSEQLSVSKVPSSSSLIKMCGCGKCNFHTILYHGCPTPRDDSKFPYLNMESLPPCERSLVTNKLLHDFQSLLSKFDTLRIKFELWVEQNVSVDQYRSIILSLSGIKSPQQGAVLFTDRKLEIKDASTLQQLSIIVIDYINWFQYHLLQRIVQNVCERYKKNDHDFKHHINLYEMELTEYCKRNIFECPMPSSFPIPPGTKYLRMKLDERFDPDTLNANEIRAFQGKLIETLNIYPDTLELICINKGCVELIYSIPASVHSELFPWNCATLKELTFLGVTEIDTEGYQAVISKKQPHLLRRIATAQVINQLADAVEGSPVLKTKVTTDAKERGVNKDLSEVLEQNYHTLVDSIQDPDGLADRLYAEGVIAKRVKTEIAACIIVQDKTRKLISAVQQHVHGNPESFQTFIDVLNKEKCNAKLVSMLLASRNTPSPPSPIKVVTTNGTDGSEEVITPSAQDNGTPKKLTIDANELDENIKVVQSDNKFVCDYCATVHIILQTANPNEYTACLSKMKPPASHDKIIKVIIDVSPEVQNVYLLGTFGGYNAALVRTNQGNKCRREIEAAIKQFSNAIAIIGVGVAYGGCDIMLGDVMVSKQIAELDIIKFKKDNETVTSDGDKHTIATKLDNTFCKNIDLFNSFECTAGSPPRCSKVHCGVIISGSFLVDNKDFKRKLFKIERAAIGGEMEGFVLMEIIRHFRGTYSRTLGAIIIKGVCDYGDGTKEKSWQPIAALAAVEYAHQMLERTEGTLVKQDKYSAVAKGIILAVVVLGIAAAVANYVYKQ